MLCTSSSATVITHETQSKILYKINGISYNKESRFQVFISMSSVYAYWTNSALRPLVPYSRVSQIHVWLDLYRNVINSTHIHSLNQWLKATETSLFVAYSNLFLTYIKQISVHISSLFYRKFT